MESVNQRPVKTWSIIPAFPRYEASTRGEIRSRDTGQILKQQQTPGGYLKISLHVIEEGVDCLKSVMTHRLIAMTWLPNPEGKRSVDHLDRCRNNNKVANLRWATALEQAANRQERILDKKVNCPRICQYDKLTNRLIAEFNNMSAASTAVLGNDSGLKKHILKCSRQEQKCLWLCVEVYENSRNRI